MSWWKPTGSIWWITIAAERQVSLADRRSLVEAALTRHKKQQAELGLFREVDQPVCGAVRHGRVAAGRCRRGAAGDAAGHVVPRAIGVWQTTSRPSSRLGADAGPQPTDISALGFKVTRAFVADQILPQEARKHNLYAELEPRRAKVREQKLIQALWEREIFAHIQIDPAQVRAFYEANAQRYARSGALGRELQAQVGARFARRPSRAPVRPLH